MSDKLRDRTERALAELDALAHPLRMQVFQCLRRIAPKYKTAGSLATELKVGASTLSAHLNKLRQAGLIERTRQGTTLNYQLADTGIQNLMNYLRDECYQGKQELCEHAKPDAVPMLKEQQQSISKNSQTQTHNQERIKSMPDQNQQKFLDDGRLKVLVLCTGNSARSIMAECLFNRLGRGRIIAFSAGSKPVGKVNKHALELLEDHGYAVADLRSKSWDEFTAEEARKSASLQFDFVITVCGNAADETCPIWPGAPVAAHWGMEDPAAVTGSKTKEMAAFEEAYELLETRVLALLAQDVGAMDKRELQKAIQLIS